MNEAAERIVESRLAHRLLEPLPEALRPVDEAAGYATQDAAHELLTAAGRGEVVGQKVGCTSLVMQQNLGIDAPCAGAVFGPSVHRGEGRFAQHGEVKVGVECEVAVWLGADLPLGETGFTREQAIAAIESCCVSIEVVEDRYAGFATLGVPTLIADDFFNAAVVLGEPVTDFNPADLRGVTGATIVNGEVVGKGVGTDLLGDPLNVLVWLATHAAQRGKPLRAGEFVTLGSMVTPHWINPGERATVVVRNEPLGEVTAIIGYPNGE